MAGPWEKYKSGPWDKYAAGSSKESGPAGLPEGVSLPSVAAHPPANLTPAIPGYDANPGAGTNFAKGVLKSVPGTVAGLSKLAYPEGAESPNSSVHQIESLAAPHGTAQAIGKGVGDAAQFLIPGGAEEKAGAFAASKLPMLGKFAAPAGRILASGLGAGAVNKAQGGDFKTGAVTGLAGGALGEGIRAAAPAFAESALGVTGNDKMYGRTVGQAILDDTRGIRPDTVERTAQDTVEGLRPVVENMAINAGNAGRRGSLDPARIAVSGRIGNHVTNRAVKSAEELVPLDNFLTNDAVTGERLATQQRPIDLLQLKRGLDSDYIGNWNPLNGSKNQLSTAREAYGKLADEFHAAAPGTEQYDQRISSLIPVINRADRMSRAHGMLESTLHRFRTPTGALVGATAGAGEGYREHGLTGAFTGAALGAVAPAVIGNPATQMLFARSANKFLPNVVRPIVVGGINNATREESGR